jgi:hypothetical protein
MHKLAVFTEGQGEQLFVADFLKHAAGEHQIRLTLQTMMGGKKFGRMILKQEHFGPEDGVRFYAQIVNCGSDSRVISEINDQLDTLVSSGFQAVVGIRDARPDFAIHEVEAAYKVMMANLRKTEIVPILTLATMELEAWFLAEFSHLIKLHKDLTVARIRAQLGLDLEAENLEERLEPAQDLARVYALEGFEYAKDANSTKRTLQLIDFNLVRSNLPARTPRISPLIQAIDAFLSQPAVE